MGLDVSKVAGFGSELMLTSYLMARDQGDYLSPDDLLQMHTLNGARAMRMDREIGSIEPGKRADLVIRSNDLPEARPMHNLERQHLLVARSRSVDTVIVDGRVVIRGGRHTWMDEAYVYGLAEEAAARMRVGAGM
jgi:cytosine/adenosine deaminase-related metal-dependent hydrolase